MVQSWYLKQDFSLPRGDAELLMPTPMASCVVKGPALLCSNHFPRYSSQIGCMHASVVLRSTTTVIMSGLLLLALKPRRLCCEMLIAKLVSILPRSIMSNFMARGLRGVILLRQRPLVW